MKVLWVCLVKRQGIRSDSAKLNNITQCRSSEWKKQKPKQGNLKAKQDSNPSRASREDNNNTHNRHHNNTYVIPVCSNSMCRPILYIIISNNTLLNRGRLAHTTLKPTNPPTINKHAIYTSTFVSSPLRDTFMI